MGVATAHKNLFMDAPVCIVCGTKHWSRMPCPSVANKADVANAVVDRVANVANTNVANARKRVANKNRIVPSAEVGADLARVLKPRRGDRAAYNARQREYMRKRRAKG